MFDVGLRTDTNSFPFARHIPVSNWPYPFDIDTSPHRSSLSALEEIDWPSVGRRAAYFHVPFCDTICTFCPFIKGHYRGGSVVEDYLRAMLRELQLKRPYVGKLKVDSIFIGGGSPSILTASQIARLGEGIHTHFDNSNLKEFAVEIEVKSVTREKLMAFKEIGVNRISFGVQTFSRTYRKVFHLDAELTQILCVAEWANELFPYTNIDMIYGIAGQQVEDVVEDALNAAQLGTTTIDFYVLNNLAAQKKMHSTLNDLGLQPSTAAHRIEQRKRIAHQMLSSGYARINGYSYALRQGSTEQLIQSSPCFLYHDILYGYHDDTVVGYGASAFTLVPGYNLYNVFGRQEYSSAVLSRNTLPSIVHHVGERSEKGIVTFPYRGGLAKSRIPWGTVPQETVDALDQLVNAGLVVENPTTFDLSEAGWLYYVNLMYFLMPTDSKLWLSEEIAARIKAGRECENMEFT